MRIVHSATLGALALVLAACGDEPASDDTPNEQGGEVSGDILGGSISDDMIHLEELRSQSPPAERRSSDNGSGGSQGASADDSSDTPNDEAEASADAPAPDALPVAPPQE